ncbi:hypothetical protein L195_g019092 [Trifolium pratense]|uniref:Uncharacterized protein n=1 Tax=Trifolium pratense TaxID=57577 RepID=A0A2K3MYM4_TRIPR|nr:hypothetical protein L195_g019092 [Trifolium pratense]
MSSAKVKALSESSDVMSMEDGRLWQRAKNPPYRPTCGTAISEYGASMADI